MVVDLASEVRIVLFRRLEYNFGSIGELVRGKIDLAKAAFTDESTKGVVTDGMEVGRGELAEERLVGYGELRGMLLVIVSS